MSSGLLGQSIDVTPATSSPEVQNYVENLLLGSCVTASNISYSGAADAAGTFDGNGTTLGLNSGILFTTGKAIFALGPDDLNSNGFNNGQPGDPDLDMLVSWPGIQTQNAAILEFDFVPQSDTLRFNYIFGSEEYPEYVNSPYNDIFGFFISGPGIAGPFSNAAENIALIPGTSVPVAINEVNNGYSGSEPATGPCENCAYYVDNSSGQPVQYDAYTTVLTAEVVVVPCQTYHIKIAIADAGDGALDSGVFLQEGSFSASGDDGVEMDVVTGVSGVSEGCDIGSFVFRRLIPGDNSTPLTVGYTVSGTAIPGVDYNALPGSVTIPAGEDSVILSIEAFLDNTPEGIESVILDLVGGGCSCVAPPSVAMNIVDNDVALNLTTNGTSTICLGQSANLTAAVTGSLTPYTGSWDNGAPVGNNVSVSPTTTTTYTYTITDACGGQTATSSETITVVNADFTVDDDQQCYQGNTFAFTNTGTSSGTVTYYWDFGDGNDATSENPTYSYSSSGTYTVEHSIIYTATACTVSTSGIVEVFDQPSLLVLVDQNVSCTGGSDGALSTFATGGTTPYSFLWLPNNETTSAISGLTAGNYSVILTDANNCTYSVTSTVGVSDTEPPVALCQNTAVQLDAFGVATISATVVDNGSYDNCGIASLVVSPNTFSCAELGANPVVLTVTDVNGNVNSCNATVTVSDTISPITSCQDITVQLDAAGVASVDASQIEISSSDNCAIQSISLSPNSFNCSNVGPNSVTLTVTDVSGNIATCTAFVTVTENAGPTALCQDLTVSLDVNGSVTVLASQLDGGTFDNCGTPTISINPSIFDCSLIGPNTVTLTATDGSGNSDDCTAIVTVVDDIPPSAVCADIAVQLNALGSVVISSSDVDGGSSDNCSITDFALDVSQFSCVNVGANSVTLTLTDASGNTSSCSANVTVQDNLAPTAICEDITLTLDPSGSGTIEAIDIDNGSNDVCGINNISLNITDFDCSMVGITTVVLTVEDNNGNTSTCSANVQVLDSVPPVAVCQDLTIYLDGSGEAIIDASDVDDGSTDNCGIDALSISQSSFICADTGQTVITLTVNDLSLNTGSCISTISVFDTISPVIFGCPADMVIIPDSADCSPVITWIEPVANDNCSVTITGDHVSGETFSGGITTITYVAEDASGNTSSCVFTVTVQAPVLSVSTSANVGLCGFNISCAGDMNGEATAHLSGGCSPYSFLWEDSQTTQTAIGLAAGPHVVIVTDANGFEAMDTIMLVEPDPITTDTINSPVYSNGTNVSCVGANDGIINLDVSGGSGCLGYDFSWTGPNGYSASTKDIFGLEEGTYVVTVTDANGCTYQDSITLTEPDPMEIQAFPTTYNGYNVSCFGQSNGLINISVSSGTSPYSFMWNNGETTEDIDSLSAGTYIVTVTDDLGCFSTLDIELVEPPQLVVVPTDTVPVSCNGASTGQFTVQANGGVPTYTYMWSNGDTDPILNAVLAGSYQVTVTDGNGCQDSLQLIMVDPPLIGVSVDQITDVTCFGGSDGAASISASGGTAPYDYTWLVISQSGSEINNVAAGTYIFQVEDATGCEVTDTLEILSADQLVVVTSNDTTVCPGTVVPMWVNVSGGGGTYLIDWNNGLGFGNTFEPYIESNSNVSVSVVDQNGCQASPNSVIVTTLSPVNVDFGYSINQPCTMPVQVDFSNNSSNAVSYNWTFGNGGSSTQFLPTTTFNQSGTYTAQLIATSFDGCVDSTTLLVTIDALPEANINLLNEEGCFPITVGLFNQSTGANSYLWNFGDGTTSTQPNNYHFYENAGSYDVTLIAMNQHGCSDTLTLDSAVFAYPRPIAGFTPVSVSFPEPGNEFSFINTSTGATYYTWNFGTGDFSELFEPIYDFEEHGNYNVVLRAYNQYGCLDTAMANVAVELTSGLFVPNAIAVGEVGDAGVFLPKGAGIGSYHLWIYDLWGNLLWESTALQNGSPAEGWDGSYKGQMVPLGSYAWKINAIFKDGIVWEGMEQSNGKTTNIGSVTVLY